MVYLGLGSNLGDRVGLIRAAGVRLQALPLEKFCQSSLYETLPYQSKDQPIYCNQVVGGETDLGPEVLLQTILQIESDLGRTRREKWESRLIDIDLLYYGEEQWDLPHLKIPHSDVHNREFMLRPLAEIAPYFVDPRFQKTISELLLWLMSRSPVISKPFSF